MLIFPSYHLLIGGSLFQSFTLFMLSLTQSGQYYQVRHSATKILYEPFNQLGITDLSCPRDWPRIGSGNGIHPDRSSGLSLFLQASYTCNEPRRFWFLSWRDSTSHHVELPVQPERRVRKRCASQCRHE